MRVTLQFLIFLAAVLSLALVTPSAAAYGGPGGAPASHGGQGLAGTATGWGSGSTFSAPGTGDAGQVHAGYGAAEASSFPVSAAQETGAGRGVVSSLGGTERAGQAGTGQEQRGFSPEGGSGVQAGYRPAAQSADALRASGALRYQAGSQAGQGIASLYPDTESREAIPPGQHRGPPARAPPLGPGSQAGRIPCGPAQTAEPLAGAAGVQDSGTGAALPQRVRKDSDEDSDEIPGSGPSWQTIPFPLLTFLGYHRIGRKNVLEHECRSRVYSAIAEHPGIDIVALERLVEINRNTLRYHLFTLIRAGKITAFSRPGMVRYFQNGGMYSPFVQCLLHYLRTDTPAEIIRLLMRTPGMTRAQLAGALSLSGPSVTRHMQNLESDGIAEVRVAGRNHHYFLTDPVREILPWYGHMVEAADDVPGRGQAIALRSAA